MRVKNWRNLLKTDRLKAVNLGICSASPHIYYSQTLMEFLSKPDPNSIIYGIAYGAGLTAWGIFLSYLMNRMIEDVEDMDFSYYLHRIKE